jgi:hypothetical protein
MEGRYFSVVVVFKQALDGCTHALEKMALSAAQPARVGSPSILRHLPAGKIRFLVQKWRKPLLSGVQTGYDRLSFIDSKA